MVAAGWRSVRSGRSALAIGAKMLVFFVAPEIEVDVASELERGREAYARRAWQDAYTVLSAADRAQPLSVGDLELLATSASLIGEMDEYVALLERVHHVHLEAGGTLPAARSAVWLGMNLAMRGELGPAGGWFGRAQRLVEGAGRECVERGYLLLPLVFRHQAARELDAAYELAEQAASIGDRFGDADLSALAMHVQGLVRISDGRVEEGLPLLDEAMVAVTAGEVSPFVAGIVYCGVIAGCEEAYDARRAQEWTNALTRWCEEQPQLVSFTGRCLAHRAGIKKLHGEWDDALAEARLARERGEEAMNRAAAGQAFYQQGDLHRLQGRFAASEEAYRDASRYGREPQPGLALLRLAQGDGDAAKAAITRVLSETSEPWARTRILPAYVEIMLAVGELDAAGTACRELAATTAGRGSSMLSAIVAWTEGAVELAKGEPRSALVSLRRAWQAWEDIDAPYEGASTRVLVALACRALADEDTAKLELQTARRAFAVLGAAPDVGRVDLLLEGALRETHGLTNRELEVLRLIAAGKTNREIAAALVVSEHTVARHVQNILAKLRLPSRTAATAFAYDHDLV
jgi:DNA-binding CsgD family transcriptional regulator